MRKALFDYSEKRQPMRLRHFTFSQIVRRRVHGRLVLGDSAGSGHRQAEPPAPPKQKRTARAVIMMG